MTPSGTSGPVRFDNDPSPARGGSRLAALLAELARPEAGVRIRQDSGFRFLAPGAVDQHPDAWRENVPNEGPPLVLVSRVPRNVPADLGSSIFMLYPGAGPQWTPDQPAIPPWTALPGVTAGPLSGAVRAGDRRLVTLLSQEGVPSSARPDMDAWLTVTSAWLGPVRGAVVAASRRGLPLASCPDLVTVAARAARERLALLRMSGVPLDVRTSCLLHLTEWWAIDEMRRVAAALSAGGDLPFLPTAAEAAALSRHMRTRLSRPGLSSPAADFLDGFSEEEARSNPR